MRMTQKTCARFVTMESALYCDVIITAKTHSSMCFGNVAKPWMQLWIFKTMFLQAAHA